MGTSWPRRFCCEEELAFIGYDGRDASKDLAAWRRGGPRATTLELVDVLAADGVEGATVIDIGAGVGAVHVGLLEAGAARAVDIDASRDYLSAARAEAERRGLADRIEYLYGDVVELAAQLPRAEVVAMDFVICCYPYLDRLIDAALRPAPRLLGLAYPRDVWWMRAYMRLYNGLQAARRSPARYFIYRHRTVRRLLAEAGYTQIHDGGSSAWRVVAYRRTPLNGQLTRDPSWPGADKPRGTPGGMRA